jgi:hypothetical protein
VHASGTQAFDVSKQGQRETLHQKISTDTCSAWQTDVVKRRLRPGPADHDDYRPSS